MKWSFDFDKEINFMLLDYIWNELNKVNDYSESFKSTVKHISFSETNIEEYIQNNRIKFVSIKNLSESNRSYLTDLSFKIDILLELAHLGQQVWWSSLSENSIEPLFVKREHIHDPKPSGYSNYDIDINHVYDLVETGIKNVDISLDKWQSIIKSSLSR